MSGAINVLVCPGCAISARAQPVSNRPAGHADLAPETDAQPRTEIGLMTTPVRCSAPQSAVQPYPR